MRAQHSTGCRPSFAIRAAGACDAMLGIAGRSLIVGQRHPRFAADLRPAQYIHRETNVDSVPCQSTSEWEPSVARGSKLVSLKPDRWQRPVLTVHRRSHAEDHPFSLLFERG